MATITETDRAAARKFSCDWTSCWAQLACPGLDGGDHSAVCDSLERETLRLIGRTREKERRECYADVCETSCLQGHSKDNNGDGCPCLAAAEQTIARRSP